MANPIEINGTSDFDSEVSAFSSLLRIGQSARSLLSKDLTRIILLMRWHALFCLRKSIKQRSSNSLYKLAFGCIKEIRPLARIILLMRWHALFCLRESIKQESPNSLYKLAFDE